MTLSIKNRKDQIGASEVKLYSEVVNWQLH